MASCKFCNIVNRKTKDHTIWENNKFIAFLDIHPAKPGHCLLIPKKHIGYFFDMEDKLYFDLFRIAKKLEGKMRKAMKAKKIGIAVVGFSSPHAHLHMVPLTGSDQMFNPISHKTTKTKLQIIQKKLSNEFKSVK